MLNQRMATMEKTNQRLAAQNEKLTVQIAQAPPQVPLAQVQVQAKPPKLNPPSPFDGTSTLYRHFVIQLTTMFNVNSQSFSSDALKILYCFSFLTGRAALWATPMIENPDRHPAIMATWNAFKTALGTTFGPVDQASTSAAALRALTQAGSVPHYVAEFNMLAADLTWNDEALTSQFRAGLSDEIKDLALSVAEPETLAEWSTLAIRLDNRLAERRRERLAKAPVDRKAPTNRGLFPRPQQPPAPAHRPAPVLAPPAPANDAMDLDAMNAARPRGPLTQAEKDRRFRERLCLVCASPDHMRQYCPVARPRYHVAAMQANQPSPVAPVPLPQAPAASGFHEGQ